MLDPMPAGPVGVIDWGTRIKVAVDGGTLESVSTLQLLAGRNLAAVRNEAGDWEVFQFANASLVANATYELSGLLRGQAGTELAMRTPLPAGARFVLLSESLAEVDITQAEVGLALNWRVGPASRDIGDASYADRQHTFTGSQSAGSGARVPAAIAGTL
jgi:hypothetical protein